MQTVAATSSTIARYNHIHDITTHFPAHKKRPILHDRDVRHILLADR